MGTSVVISQSNYWRGLGPCAESRWGSPEPQWATAAVAAVEPAAVREAYGPPPLWDLGRQRGLGGMALGRGGGDTYIYIYIYNTIYNKYYTYLNSNHKT